MEIFVIIASLVVSLALIAIFIATLVIIDVIKERRMMRGFNDVVTKERRWQSPE